MPSSRDTRPEDLGSYSFRPDPPRPRGVIVTPLVLALVGAGPLVLGVILGAYIVYQQGVTTDRTAAMASLIDKLQQQQTQLSETLKTTTEQLNAVQDDAGKAKSDLATAKKQITSMKADLSTADDQLHSYDGVISKTGQRCGSATSGSTAATLCQKLAADLKQAGLTGF